MYTWTDQVNATTCELELNLAPGGYELALVLYNATTGLTLTKSSLGTPNSNATLIVTPGLTSIALDMLVADCPIPTNFTWCGTLFTLGCTEFTAPVCLDPNELDSPLWCRGDPLFQPIALPLGELTNAILGLSIAVGTSVVGGFVVMISYAWSAPTKTKSYSIMRRGKIRRRQSMLSPAA